MIGLRFACLALLLFAAPLGAALPCNAVPTPPQVDEDQALVSVLVVDEDKAPVHDAFVRLYMTADQRNTAGRRPGAGHTNRTKTDGKSSFRIDPTFPQTLEVCRMSGEGELVRHVVKDLLPGDHRDLVVTLRLRNDATFHGLLIDGATGKPIAGALIDASMQFNWTRIAPGDERLAASSTPVAESDSDGSFSLPAATFTGTDLRIFAPGYAPRFMRIDGSEGPPGITKADAVATGSAAIKLERATVLQVTVVDARPGIRVEATFHGSSLYGRDQRAQLSHDPVRQLITGEITESDTENGAFVYFFGGLPSATDVGLRFLRGPSQVVKVHEVRTSTAGTTTRMTFDLSTDGRVEGTLVDSDGAAVPRVEIWLGRPPPNGSLRFHANAKPINTARTNALGEFSFTALTVGEYLVARTPKAARGAALPPSVTRGVRFKLTAEKKSVKVNLQSQPSLTIEGTLLDHEGDPCNGQIHAVRARGDWSAYAGTVAADGSFQLDRLLPGIYRVTAGRAGALAGPPIEVVAGARGIKVHAPATGMIAGRVVDAITGEPVSEADVRFQDSRTGDQLVKNLKPDGTFVFAAATAGKHMLIAWTQDGRITEPTSVTLAPGEAIDDMVLRVGKGTVLEVSAQPADDRIQVTVVTKEGARLNESAPPGGPIRMTLPAGRFDVHVSQRGTDLESRFTVDLEPGEVHRANAELAPPKEAAADGEDR